MRFGKVFRFGGNRRTAVNLDLYNALDADTIRTVNDTFGSWLAGGPRPPASLLARFAKVNVTLDF